jgi:hypothetical protein
MPDWLKIVGLLTLTVVGGSAITLYGLHLLLVAILNTIK